MKIPTFPYPGGKAKIRDWLMTKFPKTGNRYGEAFGGRGNVFFSAITLLDYKQYCINDLFTAPFFRAILNLDLTTLPTTTCKEDYENFRRNTTDLSLVLEPYLTYFGKGYDAGYRGDIRYNKKSCIVLLDSCKRLLRKAKITGVSWDQLDWWDTWDEQDFVYLDPPYYGTEVDCYPNINHELLVTKLKKAKFRWTLSGYENPLYNDNFGKPLSLFKNAEMKSCTAVQNLTESLWSNY